MSPLPEETPMPLTLPERGTTELCGSLCITTLIPPQGSKSGLYIVYECVSSSWPYVAPSFPFPFPLGYVLTSENIGLCSPTYLQGKLTWWKFGQCCL